MIFNKFYRLPEKGRERGIFSCQLLILFLLCFVHALSDGHTCDFWPINGTFQNFNPVRRFLAGQIPYRDFSDYLGLGHLYAGSVFSFLFGGNYQASLIAFSFLQVLSLALISIGIGRAILKNARTAIFITNVFLFVLLLQPAFYASGFISGANMRNALNSCLGVGNSARFIRGMILGILMLLFFAGERMVSALLKKLRNAEKYSGFICAFAFGMLSGFSVLWSNDYGISSFICAFCVFSWVVFCKTRSVGQTVIFVLLYFFASLFGAFLFGEFFTLGHFGAWLKSTFGIGGFQQWYYGSGASSYFFQVDLSFLTIFQLLVCFVYGAKIFICRASKASVFRYGMPAFCNLTAYCAVNEYKLLSGGLIYEVAYSVLFLTIAFETISFLKSHFQITKKNSYSFLTIGAFVLCTAWLSSNGLRELFFYAAQNSASSIAELGRGGVSLYSDLTDAKHFLGDKKIFATYASAQEVVQNQFQPSGYDYIIHVLGDEQRKKYLESFSKSDFDYAVTIREEHNTWEYWIKRANWFFYRELYSGYHPVFENSYEQYWKKNSSESENTISAESVDCVLEIEQINSFSKKIILKCHDEVNGTADLFIDYEIKKNKKTMLSHFIFNMNLLVTEASLFSGAMGYRNTNSLRAKSAEYIPVEIKDGYGELILTAKPGGSTILEINALDCERIFCIPKTENFKYGENVYAER